MSKPNWDCHWEHDSNFPVVGPRHYYHYGRYAGSVVLYNGVYRARMKSEADTLILGETSTWQEFGTWEEAVQYVESTATMEAP